MPVLIKKIEGELIDNIESSVNLFKEINGEIQSEDYINMSGLIALLQDFTRIENTEKLTKPVLFGLKNINNLTPITLEIDY